MLQPEEFHAQYFGLSAEDLICPANPSALSNSVLLPENMNLLGSQKELLLWHQRLGHRSMHFVQRLLSRPMDSLGRKIITPLNKRASSCTIPICEACQYAKQKRKVPRRNATTQAPEGGLQSEVLSPGQRVSADTYKAAHLGRLQNTRGRENDSDKYVGGTILLDIASKFIYLKHSPNHTAEFVVKAKHEFESFANDFNVKIREYAGDNTPFGDNAFRQDCEVQGQRLSLSGPYAHHQNSIERYIQTVFNSARAMMLHTALHWPGQANLDLWPFALNYAVWIWNNTPDLTSGLCPYEVFTGTAAQTYSDLRRVRVFGCPVYVLHPKLTSSGGNIAKWRRRSSQHMFLGFSKDHHTSVVLVLDLETGSIKPSYHVVFDEQFSTVSTEPEIPILTRAQTRQLLDIGGLDRHPDLAEYDLLEEDEDSPTGTIHDPRPRISQLCPLPGLFVSNVYLMDPFVN
jgi:hypothetical protein